MKRCPRCKKEKDLSFFGSNKSRKDGKQVYCIDCMREFRREHYLENKAAHYERNRMMSKRLRQIVVDAKNVPCVDCGVFYPGEPWLMDFDHIIPSEKVSTVSAIEKGGNKAALVSEIDKCEVVCLICHRRRTARKLNWKTNRYKSVV